MTASLHSLLLTNVGSCVGDLVMVTVGALLGREVGIAVGIRLGICFHRITRWNNVKTGSHQYERVAYIYIPLSFQ